MVVSILAIERSKDVIDGVKERPPAVTTLVCSYMCKGKEITKKYGHLKK